jgi:multidrug efflux pump subunit AcrA (membrane-fusion protein)
MKKVATFVVAAIAAGFVAGCGSSGNSDQAKQALASARAQIGREQQSARAQIASQRRRARDEVATMRQQVRSERAKLRRIRGDVKSEQGTLSQLQGQVSGVRHTIAQNTFDGTGTFLVGSDIQPGEYRATASPGCYWARPSSLDTSDILDNDNADGPVVVQILPSDKAFQADGCGSFHKIG